MCILTMFIKEIMEQIKQEDFKTKIKGTTTTFTSKFEGLHKKSKQHCEVSPKVSYCAKVSPMA